MKSMRTDIHLLNGTGRLRQCLFAAVKRKTSTKRRETGKE
jgi:hypothetical protein